MRTAHAPPLPAPQEPAPALTGSLLLNLAHTPLTKQELDAARNCVSASQHTRGHLHGIRWSGMVARSRLPHRLCKSTPFLAQFW
jgi:hypothetical protein